MHPLADDYDEGKDRALVSEACAGSTQAMEALARAHQRFIYNIALRMVRDAHDAADLTQEIPLKMLTNLSKFENKSKGRETTSGVTLTSLLKAPMDKTTNGLNAVLGALTADAAALGLHWLYDTDRLAEVAGDHVVFRQPRIEDYEGFTGYFAHGWRKSGDLSHYGESLMVMLRSLTENYGEFAAQQYQKVFKLYFGPGGCFVGYIDNATPSAPCR